MLGHWISVGYLLLFAIALFVLVVSRRSRIAASAALVVGLPLWLGWEYARPSWTTGIVSGTEVRRTDPDRRGNTTDLEYIYMRDEADAGIEFINDDSWWWLKRNSERVFNDAKTAQDRNATITVMWDRWRSTLFSWYPNVIATGTPGSWPLWSWRTLLFYAGSIVVWGLYFCLFCWLRNGIARRERSSPVPGCSNTSRGEVVKPLAFRQRSKS